MADELSDLEERLKSYRAGSLEQQATAYAGLALVAAIRRFDQNTTRLTWVLVILTGVIAVLTLILIAIDLHGGSLR
jgi:hypothetical protein